MPRTVAPNVTLYERTELGWPATVYNSDGTTPRPKMAAPATWKTVHYTGANVDYADKGDFVRECQDLERYAVSAGKSNEYNWIIGADGPANACIATYAGDHQAAHSAGENGQAIGILFLNGVGQPVTDSQVVAFQWLVADLASRGRTGASTKTTPHKDMPDAATPCPGDQVLARWNDLLIPYTPDGPAPSPPPADVTLSDDDLAAIDRVMADRLNTATAAGQLDWAGTVTATLGQVQNNYNQIRVVQEQLDKLIGLLEENRRSRGS